jgi:type III secretion protein J
MMSACGEKSVARVSTEGEAIEIISVLTEHGFEVEKKTTTEESASRWDVVLDEGWFGGGEVARAMQVLRYYGLPRPEEKAAQDAESGMFPSPSVEKMRQLKEREREMERKLRMLPGVARVNATIVLPDEDALKLNPYPATASIWIVHQEPKPAFSGEHVQNQVAGGVPGLKPESVTVLTTYEPPPLVPRQELGLRRRNNLLLAGAVALVAVMSFVLVVLLLQMRRQRGELASLREAGEPPPDDTETDADAALETSTGVEQRQLRDEQHTVGAKRLPTSTPDKQSSASGRTTTTTGDAALMK